MFCFFVVVFFFLFSFFWFCLSFSPCHKSFLLFGCQRVVMFFVFCCHLNTHVEFFSKMVLVLIAQHNVHRQPIIQLLLMIGLMAFSGFSHNSEKLNLLMVIMEFELSKIVLLQHKIVHNLINSIIVYYIQILNAIIQLNFIFFKRNINYNSKILQEKETMQCV